MRRAGDNPNRKLGSLKTAANSAAGFDFDAAFRDKLEKTIFRVGRYWISDDPTEPSVILGFGTWVRVEGRMIMGASAQYPAGTTGGSATQQLTLNHMPYGPWSGYFRGGTGTAFYVAVGSNYGFYQTDTGREQYSA